MWWAPSSRTTAYIDVSGRGGHRGQDSAAVAVAGGAGEVVVAEPRLLTGTAAQAQIVRLEEGAKV